MRFNGSGELARSVFGPSTWNDLPLPLRLKPSLDSVKCNLKTFLFPKLQTCHIFCSVLLSSSTSSPRLLPVLRRVVRMFVCAGASVYVRVYALRMAFKDMILRCTNNFIIIISVTAVFPDL